MDSVPENGRRKVLMHLSVLTDRFWRRIENGRVKIETTAGVFRDAGISEKPQFYLEMEEDLCALKLTPGISREMVRQILMQTKGVLIEGFGLGGIPNYLEEVFEEVMPLRKRERLSYSDGDTGFAGRNGFECVRSGTSGKERVGHGRIRKTYGRSSHSLHDVADGSSGERKYIGNM